MHAYYKAYLDILQTLHAEAEKTITGLSKEALDWKPGFDVNSLCMLIVHMTGAERYWIGDVVGRDPSGRDRDAEFKSHGMDESRLKERLAETLVHSRGILEKLTLSDLEGVCVSPRDGKRFTTAWALTHALEHTALHLGHMQIMRQLWDQQ